MNNHPQFIIIGKITFVIVFSMMCYLFLPAQTDSRTLQDLVRGNNRIFLHDPMSVIPPIFDLVPSNSLIEAMGSGILANWKAHEISAAKSVLTIQLFTNEDTIQPDPVRELNSLNINAKYLMTNGTIDSTTEIIRLKTDFNNTPTTSYVFYHSVKIDSVLFAYIEVEGIEYGNSTISPLLFDHVITGHDTIDEINSIHPVRLVARLNPIHTYYLNNEIPSNGSSPSACNIDVSYMELTGDIRMDWSAANTPSEVSYTELEWTFVNTYPGSSSGAGTIYDFRMNNTSVQISASAYHYSLPMIFEKGVLICRYRWISLRGPDRKPVYSAWSLPESGTIGSVTCGKFEITTDLIHEKDRKNWQCTMTFAEEGKNKTVVSYFDGTMRNRQSVTRLSESNTVIVGETIYDFQGRPAIQVLPVPVGLMDFPLRASAPHTGIDVAPSPSLHSSWHSAKETIILDNLGLLGPGSSSTSSSSGEGVPDVPGQYLPQKIQYYQNFTLNNTEDTYSWRNFDTGTLCDTASHTESMSNTKGAARYYSSINDDQTGFNTNIPNANGYPFIQTEYTPDNTGRICRQGSVGEILQLRRGHDTRYYYGSPSQDELDRLFGSDAGLAGYYKKNMITDGNNQTAVEYVDMKGKVVASGLAGMNPASLDPLDNRWTFRNTMDLLASDIRVQNELKNTLRSTTRLLIEQNGTDVSFEYELPANQFSKDFCTGNICLDCEYDYTIQVLDECGAIKWTTTEKRVGADEFNKYCDVNTSVRQPRSITLNKGVYTVSRTLSVTTESIEKYGLLYDSTTICQKTKDSLKLVGKLNFPSGACNLTCENCDSMTYARRHAGEVVMHTIRGISMPYKITQADIDRDSIHCSNLCKTTTSNLENILSMMRNDVSVNGMYGEIYQHFSDDPSTVNDNEERDSLNPSAFLLSVFNTTNDLGTGNRNWRYPSKNKFNTGGPKYYELDTLGNLVESWVTIPVSREREYRHPGNSEVYAVPAGKHRIVNGRLQIKPEVLRDETEFVDAWKAEWANALLPYHPEYLSLLWYIENTASNDYDEKLNSIQSYHEAEAFMLGITAVDHEAPAILRSDPFFIARNGARMLIKGLLFEGVDGVGRNPIEIQALSSAYCAIENLPTAELNTCLESRHLYDNAEMNDVEWQLVRSLYLQHKHHIQDSLRNSELRSDEQYSNESSSTLSYRNPSELNIGDRTTRPSNPYWDKVMRFPAENDIMKNMFGCPQLESVLGAAHILTPNIACMRDRAADILYKQCGKCPLAQELETLLSYLASQSKLTSNANEGMIGRLISSIDMISSLGSPHVRRMLWMPVISGNQLRIDIKAQDGFTGSGATYSQFISLKSIDSNIQWNKIRLLRCLNYTADPELYADNGKNFTLRGIDEYGKEFLIEGTSSCFIIDSCKVLNSSSTPNTLMIGPKTCCTPWPPATPLPINDCNKNIDKLRAFFYDQSIKDKIEYERIELRKEYTDVCLDNADIFKATLDNSIYQLTLYYYDQAGNLIKTIPPAGVDTLRREDIRRVQMNRRDHVDEITIPNHTMASTYKYNAQNQVIEKTSPDAGLVQLMYDSLGRVHLSQDAVQRLSVAYHYVLFDKLGRISESGQALLDVAGVRSAARSHTAVKRLVSSARRTEVSHIYYDRPISPATNSFFSAQGQQQLRNRVSSSVFSENGNIENYNTATHYSYDYHGNVKTLIQEHRDKILTDRGQSRKRIDYDYDLISAKTNKVCYQCDSTDQFIHRYEYDADNRITNVFTGTRIDRLQHDAEYLFYKHGPLARINLGDRLVQGIDYAYTLHGWLKGINSNTSNPGNDMGGDGGTGSPFAADRYGFSMHYFNNDYSPIATRASADQFLASAGTTLTGHLATKGLYTGNIASTAATIKDVTGPEALLHLYTYDQLQRLKTSNSYTGLNSNTWGTAGTNHFRTSYSYDPNGNITNLTRSADGTQFDNLTYTYPRNGSRLQNNKLLAVTESAGASSGAGDISGNIDFSYDQNGNITSENSAILQWTTFGRIKAYGTDQQFAYDSGHRRVKKTDGTNTQFYVYDPTGNIIALYKYDGHYLHWLGNPIYGTARLGMYHADKRLPYSVPGNIDTLSRGNTEYELTNHLGDVLATISDKKLRTTEGTSTYGSDILTAQEYLPFGMHMPNRTYSSTAGELTTTSAAYPFAYNGMERDKKDRADGYTTEFRQYDSRIGRWKSMDPKTEKTKSYYDGMGNNPIALIDKHGDEGSTPSEINITHSPSTSENPVAPENNVTSGLATGSDWAGGINNSLSTAVQIPDVATVPLRAAENALENARVAINRQIEGLSRQIGSVNRRRLLGPTRVAEIQRLRGLAERYNARIRGQLAGVRNMLSGTHVERISTVVGHADRIGHFAIAAEQYNRGDTRGAVLTVAQDVLPAVIDHYNRATPITGGRVGQAVTEGGEMVSRISQDAGELVSGRMGAGTYVARFGVNLIITGAAIILPVPGWRSLVQDPANALIFQLMH